MDITEKCSLLMLALAYVVVIMLIVIYEVMECRYSHLFVDVSASICGCYNVDSNI